VILAECEHALGLPVSEAQVKELRAHTEDIDFEAANAYEKKLRHDVMAHVHAYGDQCPGARAIIHLGATSCYVGDNTDIWILRDALKLVQGKLVTVIQALYAFADAHRAQPTLAFTHFQPAQPTTVGKRCTLWMQDLMDDLMQIQSILDSLLPLGCKGTTGTQASFLELFDGDYEKVKQLDQMIAEKMGFPRAVAVSGQTYSRKIDSRALYALSSVAQSAHKFSNDLRLLSHLKEMEEPLEKTQIGSSAMAYKRNPRRAERMGALCRFVIANAQNAAQTAAEQWLERTLDDSANRRIAVAEGFLAVDAILNLYANIAEGLVTYPKVMEKRLRAELPFMATENILMDAVKRGGDRQALHERIRVHAMEASYALKAEGKEPELLRRIAEDPAFGLDLSALEETLDPAAFIGCAALQTEDFLRGEASDCLNRFADLAADTAEVTV
jgi:adenylosuccinate lyase